MQTLETSDPLLFDSHRLSPRETKWTNPHQGSGLAVPMQMMMRKQGGGDRARRLTVHWGIRRGVQGGGLWMTSISDAHEQEGVDVSY